MNKDRLVIVGNGMVSLRFLQKLVERGISQYDITVLGAELDAAYNRILLSQVVSGEAAAGELQMESRDWYARHGITLRTDAAVTRIDRERQVAVTSSGEYPYNGLVLTVGSDPIVLPIPGVNLPGVFAFRDLRDTQRILDLAKTQPRTVVIGGGLLGLELAAGLRARGCPVTVVHLMATLMERQLDPSGAKLVQRSLEARGLVIATAAQTQAILGTDGITGVQLADGTTIPAEMVVMAVGARPNRALAQQAGLACRSGVLVDDRLVTSDPNIFALGECSEHRGRTYGFVAPLYEQAEVLARRLTGEPEATFTPEVAGTTLKVSGVDVFSVGEFQDESGEAIFLRDFGRGAYRRLSVSDGRLVGAVLCGEVQDGPWYTGLIRRRLDVTPIRDHIVFGQHHVDAWLAAEAAHTPPSPGPGAFSAAFASGGAR